MNDIPVAPETPVLSVDTEAGGPWHARFRTLLPGVLSTSVPIAIGQIGQMTMILIDMYMVGKLGAAAISGVGLGSAFFYVFGLFSAGVLFGLDYYVAHAMGRADIAECNRWLWQGCWLSLLLAVPQMALIEIFVPPYLAGNFPVEVAKPATEFLHTLNLCFPGFMIFVTFRQYLQATGSVRAGTVVTLCAIGSNVTLNGMLVLGWFGAPAMGVGGSGLATSITRTGMAAVLAGYALYRDRKMGLGLAAAVSGPDFGALWKLIKMGVPIGLQLALEAGVFSLTTALISKFGVVSAASHTIVMNVASFIYTVPTAIAGAAAILVGQALGRGHSKTARDMGWTAIGFAALFMFFGGLTVAIFGRQVVGLFTKEVPILDLASQLIGLVAVFQVADAVQSVGGGALRGLGESKPSMIANFIGYWLVGLPLAYLLGQHLGQGARGFWRGLTIGLFAVAAVVLRRWVIRSRALKSEPPAALAANG